MSSKTVHERLDELEKAVFGDQRKKETKEAAAGSAAAPDETDTSTASEQYRTLRFLDSTYTKDDFSVSRVLLCSCCVTVKCQALIVVCCPRSPAVVEAP